jgi:hypothetical protein
LVAWVASCSFTDLSELHSSYGEPLPGGSGGGAAGFAGEASNAGANSGGTGGKLVGKGGTGGSSTGGASTGGKDGSGGVQSGGTGGSGVGGAGGESGSSAGCPKDTFGPECAPCTCVNGSCDEGVEGNGTCLSCATGWAGLNCTVCAAGYFGASCAPCDCSFGNCADGLAGDGECSCDAGFSGDQCKDCTGPDCDRIVIEDFTDVSEWTNFVNASWEPSAGGLTALKTGPLYTAEWNIFYGYSFRSGIQVNLDTHPRAILRVTSLFEAPIESLPKGWKSPTWGISFRRIVDGKPTPAEVKPWQNLPVSNGPATVEVDLKVAAAKLGEDWSGAVELRINLFANGCPECTVTYDYLHFAPPAQ